MQARTGTYGLATLGQVVQLTLTVIVPVIFSLTTLHFSVLRPYLACYSLIVSVVDVLVIDRFVRSLTKKAAIISEMFDTRLLKIEWNAFVVGKQLSHEEIKSSAWYCAEKQKPKLLGWYPNVICVAPLEVARLVCQRTNLSYDSKVRGFGSGLLLAVPVIYVVIMMALGVALNLSFDDLVLNVVSPSVTVLIWATRERFRQNDAITANDSLRTEVERVWEALTSNGKTRVKDIEARTRQLQDGIFVRRSQNPLTLPCVYRLVRQRSEEVMNFGAKKLLADAGYDVSAFPD